LPIPSARFRILDGAPVDAEPPGKLGLGQAEPPAGCPELLGQGVPFRDGVVTKKRHDRPQDPGGGPVTVFLERGDELGMDSEPRGRLPMR
jgi:hypothetical protein